MTIHATKTAWVLETQSTAYAFGLNAAGVLVNRYWGARLPRITDYPPAPDAADWAAFTAFTALLPEEFPTDAGPKFIEPCLKVAFSDGVRDTVLVFDSHEVAGDELRIVLRDQHYPLRVTLHYRAHEHADLIERWATIQNHGEAPVTLERVFSAQWHVPPHEAYRLSHLHGRWLDETHLTRDPLTAGVKVLESRRLTTSHHHNPWFALDRLEAPASESVGDVWFGVLAWSGNWKITAEVTSFGGTRVGVGLNDWDFALRLDANGSYRTPSSIAGYSAQGFGQASRNLHDFVRDAVVPHPNVPRKVLYNSWEATYFDVDEASQVKLAEVAAEMGVELFVLDDGWFHGRKNDHAGLGDWWPDEQKFPNGLTPLIDRVKTLGMEFGLWLEPEMVNPDSDLYRAHPDWVIHFPTRERTQMRNQLILNVARTDVQDHLIGLLDRLLSDHDIRFIKWDMNRNVSEPGWPEAITRGQEARELWVRYVEGLYRIWGTLRERHPHVIWQSCSGGGGRADLGILRLTDQVWISDNTEAASRLRIQEGFSNVFPASVMECWATDTGADRHSLEFRMHVAMTGVLGVGGDLLEWSRDDRMEAKRLIAQYKEVRHIVQFGDAYRLRSAFDSPFSSVQYVSKDQSESVVFGFRTHFAPPMVLPNVRLQGLDPNALYEVEGEGARSGAAWMNAGLNLELNDMYVAVQDFHSVMRRIRRVGG